MSHIIDFHDDGLDPGEWAAAFIDLGDSPAGRLGFALAGLSLVLIGGVRIIARGLPRARWVIGSEPPSRVKKLY